MPSAAMDSHGIAAVTAFGGFLQDLLSRAESVKRTASIEPPLDKSDFADLQKQLTKVLSSALSPVEDTADARKTQRFAVIETAVRDTFSNLIATISIDDPAFVTVWNLFDILTILSDGEQCDPALLLWLVEELLDSQTIAGCRKVFDFLESRRERITAKHFKQKQLVILRTCNELLRRLSRALDPAFCGRVFIFMFQSFPLGDKSSVNLRGEYHVENVTTFDREPLGSEGDAEKMDIDEDEKTRPRAAGSDSKKQGEKEEEKPLDPDTLYPIFWSLQESFNQPKRLFEQPQFAAFKFGLEATIATFRSIKPEQASRSREKMDKLVEENSRVSKRKPGDGNDELASAFNPKYLTSRDLFKLEINDLAFRRNVLVQALIVMEFLLALSTKAKDKLSGIKAPNKSVTYSDQQLNEEDTEWVMGMKKTIAEYLKQGSEGPYFYRMVETVLSRDKNWVRWKIENCPSIELPFISPQTFVEARNSANKLATTKRLRTTPLGSLSLDFLDDDDEVAAMDRLKAKDRYELPDLSTFQKGIANDDFEIDMPTNNETKAAAIEGKASKSWRALRIASRFKLAAFDKIESDDKIDAIFEDRPAEEPSESMKITNGDTIFPEDCRPTVVVDGAGLKTGLIAQLLAKHPGTLTKVPAHVIRKPEEGETNGKDFHFVNAQSFNMMRDGDQFLAFSEEGDASQGISRRVVDSISEGGKVALLAIDRDFAQQVKDFGFSAGFIFIQPPDPVTLEAHLKENGLKDEQLQKALKAAVDLAEHAATPNFYDTVVDSDFKALEAAIFGSAADDIEVKSTETVEGDDVAMEDAAPEAK
ncbi:THO complex subunit 1 transcription elongation factor-domain-containing protein [Lasiosphaeria hispida]|uniref:THO complex subunit 1 transcription elongation factor-domain-containing protein n=1 Tax=Lasiosphaeria hispida TaxID=260671 RepID=A0AAJ0HLP4_9PEZI|nr:THO complex subunit 1 transcription elongation factor-domain-containing protein [Lasiosphaeria hispida]